MTIHAPHRILAAILLVFSVQPVVGADTPLSTEQGSLLSEYGCTLEYERHYPEGAATREVILAHGFMRQLKHMRGWAAHWREQGIGVTLVSFCNSSWFNGHHERNADDLVALRKRLQLRDTIYAGFSAGGLAAYLAASRDEEARAYLGLDSVDSGDLATDSTSPLGVPSLFITGEPSMCNARGNFQPLFDRWNEYRVEHVGGASHCDFELPRDKRCRLLCGGEEGAPAAAIQESIRRIATDWLLR